MEFASVVAVRIWFGRVFWLGDYKKTLGKACADVADGGKRPLIVFVPVPYYRRVVAEVPPCEAFVARVHMVGMTARIGTSVGRMAHGLAGCPRVVKVLLLTSVCQGRGQSELVRVYRVVTPVA